MKGTTLTNSSCRRQAVSSPLSPARRRADFLRLIGPAMPLVVSVRLAIRRIRSVGSRGEGVGSGLEFGDMRQLLETQNQSR